MKKFSKRYQQLKALISKKTYSISEGVSLIKSFQTLKFPESVEAHISLNIDPKYADQQLRASLILPNGTGKEVKIAVFTEAENIKNAIECGAFRAGAEDLLEDIKNENICFDVLITTPQLMPKLAKFGKILGPKSLMPSPKSGTVTSNIQETIKEFKKGKLEYRADKTGIIHLVFGKSFFDEKALTENAITIYESIQKYKPSGVKGKYFDSFHICTTMSPSIRIDLNSFRN